MEGVDRLEQGWLIVLLSCLLLLIIIIVKTKPDIRWFVYALLQLVLASIILFILNGVGVFGDFYIPINLVTLFTIAILGLPGLALLVVIKLTLV